MYCGKRDHIQHNHGHVTIVPHKGGHLEAFQGGSACVDGWVRVVWTVVCVCVCVCVFQNEGAEGGAGE